MEMGDDEIDPLQYALFDDVHSDPVGTDEQKIILVFFAEQLGQRAAERIEIQIDERIDEDGDERLFVLAHFLRDVVGHIPEFDRLFADALFERLGDVVQVAQRMRDGIDGYFHLRSDHFQADVFYAHPITSPVIGSNT